MNIFVLPHFSLFWKVISMMIYLTQVFSHFYTALINPGIPQRKYFLHQDTTINEEDTSPNQYFCRICMINMEQGKFVLHCFNCNMCIEGFDHHCVWIGKCIGQRNFFSFNVFTASTMTFIILNISIFFYYLFSIGP